jgi:hypothetical protein
MNSRRILLRRLLRAHWIALVCALLAAFVLRLYHLGEQSLWYDETVSAVLAGKSSAELIAHTARDIHPPLYYLLLHFWQIGTGNHDFSLAFFSLFWGMVLIAGTGTLARWVGGRQVALVTVALLTLAPFHIWYSQEVRMYTLGATFGVWTLMALWQLFTSSRMKKRWMLFWLISAVAGLYTLYYFAFLLVWEAIVVAVWMVRLPAPQRTDALRRWGLLAVAVVVLYAPWIPTAWRQATEPPVPPWRQGTAVGTMVLETISAYVLGQSTDYQQLVLPMAGLILVFLMGLGLRQRLTMRKAGWLPIVLLGGSFIFPFLILVLSTFTPSPLYHVRYTFTYVPAFYILLAMAFAGWTRFAQQRGGIVGSSLAGIILFIPLVFFSAESLNRFWTDNRYASDDLRGGVAHVEQLWRDTDVVLANAGYTYTALDHYLQDPIAWQGRFTEWQADESYGQGVTIIQSGSIDGAATLGWGLPESDFYPISTPETIAVLNEIKTTKARLWQFRLYDTVTDPQGVIRSWLEQNALLFYDEPLTGESNARVQGWYFPPAPTAQPTLPVEASFGVDGQPLLTLYGADDPTGTAAGGGWVDIPLWLEGSATFDPSTRLSLGLFDTTPARRQWAVADEQVLGPLLSLQEISGKQRWTVRLRLPQGVPPGKYDALLKFYRPTDGVTLTASGERVEGNGQQVRVAVVEIAPTPPLASAPEVGTPLNARFGPVEFLGHAIPQGPWEPGASISVELVWRKLEEGQNIRSFITSDALASDDGGVVAEYPFTDWRTGAVVRDIHYITIAPDAAPGTYPLFLRVAAGTESVPWTQGFFQNGEVLQLGNLEVVDRPREFEKPPTDTPLSVAFGDSIELVGATLPAPIYAPGTEVPLTLHWYATGRSTTRWKVFTHIVAADGTLQAQRDLEPGDGALPTNGWASGEFVSMAYGVMLPPDSPPGVYEVRVGLYDPITNQRAIPIGAGANGEERYVVLGRIEVQ